jgi:hypothetical protein
MNRILDAIRKAKLQIDGRISGGLTTKAATKKLHRELDMKMDEYAMFQELKTLAVSVGLITTEEGMTVYQFLGNTPSVFNKQPVEVKVVLTRFFSQLLEARLKSRGATIIG